MAAKDSDFYSEEDFDAILAALEEEDNEFEKDLCTVVDDVSYFFFKIFFMGNKNVIFILLMVFGCLALFVFGFINAYLCVFLYLLQNI